MNDWTGLVLMFFIGLWCGGGAVWIILWRPAP